MNGKALCVGRWALCVVRCALCVMRYALGIALALSFGSALFAEELTYASKGKRDPFVPLVGSGAVYQVKEISDITSIEDVSLEGIVYDGKGKSLVIMNGLILKEGDQAGAVIVDKIEPKKVILRVEDNVYEKVLTEEEKGGEER